MAGASLCILDLEPGTQVCRFINDPTRPGYARLNPTPMLLHILKPVLSLTLFSY
jgi:hypothetical protein